MTAIRIRVLGLVAIGALAALGCVALLWQSSSAPTDLDVAVERDRGAEGETAGPIASSGSEPRSRMGALAPVEVPGESAATAEEAEAALRVLENEALPAFGNTRIVGVVLDDESQAPIQSEGAEVRFYEDLHRIDGYSLIGSAPIQANGSFRFETTRFAGRSRFDERSPLLDAQVIAPGYQSYREQLDVESAAGGVLSTTLYCSRGGVLAEGVVVDDTGAPVFGAAVRFVEWGFDGAIGQQDSVQTDDAGHFGLRLEGGRFVDCVAFHSGHGDAKGGAELTAGARSVDLGTLVLRSRGVLEGVVLGYGDLGIPSMNVDAMPLDEDSNHVAPSVESGLDGTFRFASVDPVPYRLVASYYDGDYEQLPLHTPDTRGIVLRVLKPHAIVTVLGPEGQPIGVSAFSVVGLDGDDRPLAAAGDRWCNSRDLADGRQSVLFGSPGRYGIGTHIFVDGERYSASRIVQMGKESRKIELRLERDRTVLVRFEVEASGGGRAAQWRITVSERSTRMRAARASDGSATVPVPPGRYRCKVTNLPYTLPFLQEVDVPETVGQGVHVVRIRGGKPGGRLDVAVRSQHKVKMNMSVSVYERLEKPRYVGKTQCVVNGPDVPYVGVLQPGEYVLRVARKAKAGVTAKQVDVPVRIEPGRTVRGLVDISDW